jgi:hypothetical protein
LNEQSRRSWRSTRKRQRRELGKSRQQSLKEIKNWKLRRPSSFRSKASTWKPSIKSPVRVPSSRTSPKLENTRAQTTTKRAKKATREKKKHIQTPATKKTNP